MHIGDKGPQQRLFQVYQPAEGWQPECSRQLQHHWVCPAGSLTSSIALSAAGLINNSVVLPWAVPDAGNGSTLLAETGTNILVRVPALRYCRVHTRAAAVRAASGSAATCSADLVKMTLEFYASLPGAQMLQEFAAVSALTGDPSYRALAERPLHIMHAANEQLGSCNAVVFRWRCCHSQACLPGALLHACYC